MAMNKEIKAYNNKQSPEDKKICNVLAEAIDRSLPTAENKIWHAHPVWFLDGNPIVGYHKLKDSVRLLFWSGQSFDEDDLQKEGSFKAADLSGANLEIANLTNSNLEGANMEGANLKDTKLMGANLKGAVLKNANLEGANFDGANLEGVNIEGANVKGALPEGIFLKGN